MKLRIALFYHSLVSDWNHGNAHFLRGVASELQARGHRIRIFEPEDSWSRTNLLRDRGPQAIEAFEQAFPHLASTLYNLDDLRLDEWLQNVDLVIVHEWNDPKLISAIGAYRRRHPSLRAFFHDTHHRALTAEEELARFDLAAYDGVLAYGASLQATYERRGWGKQVHVWHEAADIRTFYPRRAERTLGDVVWIGNWGDEERSEELREYFIQPVKRASWKAEVYGVRYPDSAVRELNEAGVAYQRLARELRCSPSVRAVPGRRSTCRVAHIHENCRVFLPSVHSRLWPVAFRWSPRHGRIPKDCFVLVRIS